MQNLKYKILFLILFFSLSFLKSSYSQIDNTKISTADSLFINKKFTESFSIYEELLEKDKMSSPSMLLKMAFIKEGLGNYTGALYYLNLYHKETNRKDALEKIEALAKKHELAGYELSDSELFYSFLHKYLSSTIFLLLVVSIFLTGGIFYLKKKNQNIIVPAVFQILILGTVFYLLNFTPGNKKGMILSSNTYVMDGPSSGAEIIEVVKAGHLVKILDNQDVWSKVTWKGKLAYIKGKNIKILK